MYDLMSIVVHLGDNTSSGHYISYVKTSRIEDPCWVKFNDSQVSYVGFFSFFLRQSRRF